MNEFNKPPCFSTVVQFQSRVLLKVSGEALAGDGQQNIDPKVCKLFFSYLLLYFVCPKASKCCFNTFFPLFLCSIFFVIDSMGWNVLYDFPIFFE